MVNSDTTIHISFEVKNKINRFKRPDESCNNFIDRVLRAIEKHNEKKKLMQTQQTVGEEDGILKLEGEELE